jgi:plastocyanin
MGTVGFLALVVGCSTSSNNGTSTSAATTGSGATSGGSSGGSSSGGTTGGAMYTVTISNYTFSPDPITVPAGATIVFNNTDAFNHSATSQAAAGNYTNAAAPGGWSFDVVPHPGMSASITVPSGIATGTVQPYFCGFHTSMMHPPSPTIHVQ